MGTLINLGVDIGQRVDPSAIVVAEVDWRSVPVQEDWESRLRRANRHPGAPIPPLVRREAVFSVRRIEAMPLGTLYADVAARVADMVAATRERKPGRPPEVRVDITGVGRPVVELICTALEDRHISGSACRLIGVTFSYGTKYESRGAEATLGKGYLVSRLQSLIQTKRLELPRSAQAMVDELLNYEIRVDPEGDARFGAFTVGSHDDQVTALGLATLEDPREYGAPRVAPGRPRLVSDRMVFNDPKTWPRGSGGWS